MVIEMRAVAVWSGLPGWMQMSRYESSIYPLNSRQGKKARKQIRKAFLFMGFIAVTVVILPTLLLAEKYENGKTWLAAHSDPSKINVDGTWNTEEWGLILLHQAKDAREITGTSDNWEIEGVVSGKTVYLMFFSKGVLGYTAEASLKEDGSLSGSYAKGIMKHESGDRALVLKKVAESQTQQTSAAGGPSAHVVVYRKRYHNCPQVKAPVMIDGKETADIQNGRYLTLNLTPGKHLVGTSTIGKMGSQTTDLDLAPGQTYYINFEFPSAWVCTIEIQRTMEGPAKEALSKLKPNDAKRVKMPDLVSLEPIGK